MRGIILLILILINITSKAQNNTEKYIDSMLAGIPEPTQINDSNRISNYLQVINRYNTTIDSLLLNIEKSISSDSFNITYNNKRYGYDNLLDYIEVKLLEDKKIIYTIDPVPSDRLVFDFKEKLDSLKSIAFSIYDSVSFHKASNLRRKINTILFDLQRNDPYKTALLYLQWQTVELNIKDKSVCCYQGKSILLRKEPNQYIPTIYNELYQPFNNFTDIIKKIEYSVELADFFQKYDRKQDVINCLSIFLSYYNDTSYYDFYYINRALDLFNKMSRADYNFKQNFVFSELYKDSSSIAKQVNNFTEATNQLIIEEFFSHTYPLLSDLLQDNQTRMGFIQRYPLGEVIYEFASIKFKLSLLKLYYIDEEFDKKFLLYPLSRSWANLGFVKETSKDHIFEDFEIFKTAHGSSYVVWDSLTNMPSWQKLLELLDDYCALSIRKNEFNRIAPVLDSFIKKFRYLGNLPKLFNYLDGRIYFEQKLYKKDSLAFQKFNDVYRRALFTDTTVKFSNHNTLLSYYDYFMENYFRNKPHANEKEFLRNSDSVFFYGYWADANSPDISYNSEIDKSILLYKNESQIKVLQRKKDTLQKSYDKSVILYNRQLKINGNLTLENKELYDQNAIIQVHFERMRKDTARLGQEKRKLNATVNSLANDTVLLNKEKIKLKVDKDTLTNRIARKNIELGQKDTEIESKAHWVFGLSILAGALILTSIFLPTIIYKRRTRHFNKKIHILEEDYENKNYKLRLEKKNAELKLLGNLAYNHDIRKFIPLFPRMINKTNETNKELHQRVATAYAKYNKLNNDVVDELLNTVKNELEIVSYSNEVLLFLRRMEVAYTLKTNFDHDHELENLLVPKNMFTSFISNSLLHGSHGKSHINIICTIQRIRNGYEFTIDDDGIGFKELGVENKKSDRGIPLLLRQVNNFNEDNKTWNLTFNLNSIQNKKQEQGVIVTFKMLKI